MPTPRKKAAPKSDAAAKKPAARKKAAPKPAPAGVEPAAARRARSAPRDDAPPPGDGRTVDLVIVESPAKAKTINKYLGSNFKVLASYGHVRDLPPSGKLKGEEVVGINIDAGWVPRYQIIQRDDKGGRGGKGRRSAEDIVAELRREANRANRVLLATDPDREGESIAWHLEQELGLDPATTFRVTFNEITKSAVQGALQNPGRIDTNRVQAQEARRVLDRVVGYPLSNLLGRKVTNGLSAGRVQSVAVKLVVDRELEIEAFKTEEYWKITALLAPQNSGVKWAADPKRSKILAKKKPGEEKADQASRERERPEDAETDEPQADTETSDAPPDPEGAAAAPVEKGGLPAAPEGTFLAELVRWEGVEPKVGTEARADEIAAALQTVPYTVSKVEQKERQDRPSPPFTTSTLQQQANIRLRFATSRTMQTAQKLYEGVELRGMGQTALITYMRTDSTRVSNDALGAVRSFIEADARLGPRYLPAKANFYASGKAAQEAHEAIRPTDVTITPRKAEDAGLTGDQLRLYDLIWRRFVASQCNPAVMAVTTVEVTAGKGLFRANGRIVKFDGHRRVLAAAGKLEDVELPDVKQGDALDKFDLFESQHFTQPPPRFSEASLVKALEKEGIGRPSTYSSIISKIQFQKYVEQDRGRFKATELGKLVTKLLVDHFPRIMDMKFTSHFEEELDEIETGKCDYKQVLNEFWDPFKKTLEAAVAGMPAQKGREIGEACPKCGRPLVEMFSKFSGGGFIGCSGWRDKENPCTYKRGADGKEIAGPEVTDIPCPACGNPMVKKEGRFGVFYTCSGPDCPTTMNQGADGKPVVTALPTQNKCPKCEKHNLLLKESKAGKKYVQCPDAKCKFISDCDDKGNPVKPPDTGIACEKCGSPMVVKVAWRGPFLSCSGYPKCRNAKSITVEVREQLAAKGIELPAAPEKKKDDAPAVEIADKCPECGGPMRLQKSRFGGRFFLGCLKYPKCKGTGKVSPALQEKIDAAVAAGK